MSRHRPPRGGILLECSVALVILGAAVLAAAQMTAAVTGQQRAATQRQLARQQAANLLEWLFALPDRELADWTTDEVQLELSETARQWLPGAVATATVASPDDPPDRTEGQAIPGRRIQVQVGWTDKAGRPARPVRLVAWRSLSEAQP
jgi:Tfp pilus assembly protein PilV